MFPAKEWQLCFNYVINYHQLGGGREKGYLGFVAKQKYGRLPSKGNISLQGKNKMKHARKQKGLKNKTSIK